MNEYVITTADERIRARHKEISFRGKQKIYLYIKISPLGLFYLGKYTQNKSKKMTVFTYLGSGKYWKRHCKAHKFRSSDIETIVLHQTYDLEEIQSLGLYYSKLFNVVENDKWANLREENGLTGGALSKETLQRISIANTGRKKTDEQRKNLSESLKGRPTSDEHRKNLSIALTGKKMSLETREKLRIINTGKILSKETLRKMSISMMGKPSALKGLTKYTHPGIMKISEARSGTQASEKSLIKRSKPILQYSIDGVFIKEWFGISQASKALKICRIAINSCCLNKCPTAYGFRWVFKTSDSYELNIGKIYINDSKIPIIQMTLNSEFIKEWDSAADAHRELKVSKQNISRSLKNENFSTGGFKWRYKYDKDKTKRLL